MRAILSATYHLFALSLLVFFVAGCALSTPDPTTVSATQPPVITKPYPRASLSNLLMAEVAAQRQEFHLAAGLYSVEAQRLDDPLVTEQAARLAAYIGDLTEAERLAALWHQQEPDNGPALEILVITALRRADQQRAEDYIQQMLDLDAAQGITRLVLQSQTLEPQQQQMLLEILSTLAEHYPNQTSLWHARTLHLQHIGQLRQALDAADTGLKLSPSNEELLVLKGSLLFQQGDTLAAKRFFTRQLKRHPDSRRLRITYLRKLMQIDDDQSVLTQLETLAEQSSEDPELLLGIALYAVERGQRHSVQPTLDLLLEQDYRTDDIYYALGHDALNRQEHDEAIEYFAQVQHGSRYLPARINLSLALLKNGQSQQSRQEMDLLREANPAQAPDLYALEASWYNEQQDHRSAWQLMSLGLEQVPDHEILLYSRAMAANKLQRIDWMEDDLRRILKTNPDNAMALNALGYTLLDQTNRIEEGFALVQRAYALNPVEPAIIDSMGWGYYRLGQLEQALDYLQRAWEQLPDPEVAAHLGEVLWQLGRQTEARALWQEALEQSPDNALITDTRQRLGDQP